MIDGWIFTYAECVTELGRMLALRFIWTEEGCKSTGAETPIGESIRMVGVFHNRGEYVQRDVELLKLMMLGKHLNTIEKYDKNLLKEFRKKFKATSKN